MKIALLAAAALLALAGCGILTGTEECPDLHRTSKTIAMQDPATGAKVPRGAAPECAPPPRDTIVAPPPP
jgi:hypothetical protein